MQHGVKKGKIREKNGEKWGKLTEKKENFYFFLILKGQQPFGAFIAPEKGLK